MKSRIKELQDYLGPRVNYNSDEWPRDKRLREKMEELDRLKKDYYWNKRIERVLRKFL